MPDLLDASGFTFDITELPRLTQFASVTDLFEEMGGSTEPVSEVRMSTLCFNGSLCRNYVCGTLKTEVLALLLVKVWMPLDETKIALVGINVTQEVRTPNCLVFENEEEWREFQNTTFPSVTLASLGY